MKENLGGNNGITLIALVITIIVLLILAGVSIAMLTGDNSIIAMANKSKEETKIKEILEQIKLEEIKNTDNAKTTKSDEKILWDSPFNYQLIGSTEQEKIEIALGRKLEATDFFYEVNMANTSYPEDKGTYIYNKLEEILIKVDKSKLKRSNGVWYWTEKNKPEIYQYFIDEAKRNEMLTFLKNEGVTEIYVSFGRENIENPTITREFVKQAYDKGIVTEYLIGDPRYILEEEQEKNSDDRIELIKKYNDQSNYNEKIRGLHYDVEIHTTEKIEGLKDWKSSNSEEEKNSDRKINYVKFVERVYKKAKEKNILVAFDVPPLTYASNTVKYRGTEKSILEHVVKNSDYISCMAYKNNTVKLFRYICLPSNTEYDEETGRLAYTSNTKVFSDGTLRNNATVHELALKYRKNIMIGVKIGEQGEKDGFYDMGKDKMKKTLASFEKIINDPNEDIVQNNRSLKEQAIEKCGYKNVKFDHYGFIFHKHTEYFNML